MSASPPPESLPFPATVDSLAADLTALGVRPGMVLLVHSSLRSLGFVNGGPVAVILALERVLGPDGTLVMPTHTDDLSDPAFWQHPPVPAEWWQTIRETMPAFDVSLTPTWSMGIIPETFRAQQGTLRSDHPQVSFAARGPHAALIVADHDLVMGLGDPSPLGRLYDLDGWVLLLGVGHGNNTSMHLAEVRANIAHAIQHDGAPMLVNGRREWVTFDHIDWNADDFPQIGADFARDMGVERVGEIAQATARLMPQHQLVDYTVLWMEQHRH